ncbi:hypothetical protein HAZT_HAZT010195 [Hyalella azteca]|nr:hypothetical protein HAZT_HAZT010195 [Hyalella azteca]
MTLTQLRQYDGTGEGKRVCVAVNGKIFDMTRSSHFYGPGGVYSAFAGHDATHALASFNIDDIKNESSDLSDLTPAQMDSVREWEMQFTEKYDYIGRLIKEGETPTEYSDEEDAKESTPDVAVDSAARLRPAAAATVQNMATEKGSGADEEKTVGDDEVKDVGSKKSE